MVASQLVSARDAEGQLPVSPLTVLPAYHRHLPPPAAVIPDQSCFLPSCCSTTALSQSGVPECLEFLGLVC